MSYTFNPFTGKLDRVTSPSGNNTEIQFNNNGAFGASSNLTYNGSDLVFLNGRILNEGTDASIQVKVPSSNVRSLVFDTDGTGIFGGFTFQSNNVDKWLLEKDTQDHFNIYDWVNDLNVIEVRQDTLDLIITNSDSNANRYDTFFKGYNGGSFNNAIFRGVGGVEFYQDVDVVSADFTVNN